MDGEQPDLKGPNAPYILTHYITRSKANTTNKAWLQKEEEDEKTKN